MSEEKKKDVTEEAKETKTEETKAETVQEEIIEEAPENTPETEKEKKEAKKDKKDPKDAQIEDLTDRLRRTMAEFDNFRKRTEKEKSAMFEIGAKDISAFANGMEMIYKQLLKNLEDAGVKPIEALGQPFDPNFHNAVMHIEDEKFGENIISQELQKGYMYRDSVVRHSMVQVAN